MVLQLALIWIIVATTLVWFVRDERRLVAVKLDEAARYFAIAPQFRHVSSTGPEPVMAPRVSRGLERAQRAYLQSLVRDPRPQD